MAQTRAQKIEELFHEALTRRGPAREEFLADACKGDHSLYLAVRSLLRHHRENDDRLGGLDPISEWSRTESACREGELVDGAYEIVRPLGCGGMGEVCLARELRLNRLVALKFLAPGLTSRPDYAERLRREALAASALNQPNILTIYAFPDQGSRPYIVSEYVEGKSLRNHIGGLTRRQALDYARQAGLALAAAHHANIVHRDIKPENIMVRPDGLIKVLDFGLAKSSAVSSPNADRNDGPGGPGTAPGLVMGTLNYMSPEQSRAENVDHRTDIWSWGIVLYEMITGRLPARSALGLPPVIGGEKALNLVLARALAAAIEDRYSTMDEALADLARVPAGARAGLRERFAAVLRAVFGATQATVARRVFSVLLLTLATYGVYRLHRHIVREPVVVESITPLTHSGNAILAAISPDGHSVAYVTQEENTQALRIRSAADDARDAITLHETPGTFSGIVFSKDGKEIFFVVRQNAVGNLYRLSLPSGVPKLELVDVDSSVSFDRAGKHFAFLRRTPHGPNSLLVKGPDPGDERLVFSLNAPDYFWTDPVWSPSGNSLLIGIFNNSGPGNPGKRMISIDLDSGARHVGAPGPWDWIGTPVWINHGHTIVFAATGSSASHTQLVEFLWPEGPFRLMTPDTRSFDHLDAGADETSLITVENTPHARPWIVSLGKEKDWEVPVREGRFGGVSWTASGRLIAEADITGHVDIWSIDPPSAKMTRITDDPSVEKDASVSPDGRCLIYASNRDGEFHLWRSNPDGSAPRRLTRDDSLEDSPVITPDGKSVIYHSLKDGFHALWKVSIDGDLPPVRLTNFPAMNPSISPNGKRIACAYSADKEKWSAAVLDADTFEPVIASIPNVPAGQYLPAVGWLDNDTILYVRTDRGVSNIWSQSLKHGDLPSEKTHFVSERIDAFAVSPDRRFLACIRGKTTSDVVLMKTAARRWPQFF